MVLTPRLNANALQGFFVIESLKDYGLLSMKRSSVTVGDLLPLKVLHTIAFKSSVARKCPSAAYGLKWIIDVLLDLVFFV